MTLLHSTRRMGSGDGSLNLFFLITSEGTHKAQNCIRGGSEWTLRNISLMWGGQTLKQVS